MAKRRSACWRLAAALILVMAAGGSRAGPPPEAAPAASAASAPSARLLVPRATGRLTAADLGLVINTADPYSLAVGEHYARVRGIPPSRTLRLELPVREVLAGAEFAELQQRIADFFGPAVQALALAWTVPYAVGCQSITGALVLGVDAELCARSCARTLPSPLFNVAGHRPFTEQGVRPAMLLAAPSVAEGLALVDRGAAADATLGRRGAPPVRALYVRTDDAARNVRAPLFPPAGRAEAVGVQIEVEPQEAARDRDRLVLVETGLARVPLLETLGFVPGALADHLTSFGGALTAPRGQMSVLEWIGAGATASYGTVSEPCNHLQKFPHPALLLAHYVQGMTALEAYWKSVAWPSQGVFVGEPLAAPFSRRR